MPYPGFVTLDKLAAAELNAMVKSIGVVPLPGDGVTDVTATIQAALDVAGSTPMPGMKFQGSGGAFQGGAQANGGGRVVLPAGVHVVSNLVLPHRVHLTGWGQGTVLLQKAGSTGPVVSNRYDGSVHAQYCGVSDLTIHGNKANQGSANDGLRFTGDTANNYTNTIDEDYDVNCFAHGVYVMQVKGTGINLLGAGANRIHDCKVRGADINGIYSFQDNHLSHIDVGWSGQHGVVIAGESCTLSDIKSWYSGILVPASGCGFYLTADSGAMSSCNAQDNRAAGFLWDGAFGWAASSLLADSNSRGSAGTYPAFDVYASGFNRITGVARNRYNAGGAAGEQASTIRVRNGSTGNVISLVAATGVWGQSSTYVQSGSTLTGNGVTINGTPQS